MLALEPLETDNVLDVPRRGSFPLSRNFAWVDTRFRFKGSFCLNSTFSTTLEGQFSLPFAVVVVDGVLDGVVDDLELVADVLVGVDLLEVDDRGVALPGRDRQLLKPSS